MSNDNKSECNLNWKTVFKEIIGLPTNKESTKEFKDSNSVNNVASSNLETFNTSVKESAKEFNDTNSVDDVASLNNETSIPEVKKSNDSFGRMSPVDKEAYTELFASCCFMQYTKNSSHYGTGKVPEWNKVFKSIILGNNSQSDPHTQEQKNEKRSFEELSPAMQKMQMEFQNQMEQIKNEYTGKNRKKSIRTAKRMVPKEYVGIIIGKRGHMIKKIERDSGARVKFLDGADESYEDDICVVTGSLKQVEAAKRLIDDIIQKEKEEERKASEIIKQSILFKNECPYGNLNDLAGCGIDIGKFYKEKEEFRKVREDLVRQGLMRPESSEKNTNNFAGASIAKYRKSLSSDDENENLLDDNVYNQNNQKMVVDYPLRGAVAKMHYLTREDILYSNSVPLLEEPWDGDFYF